jgi:hypothetical protein
VGQRRGADRRGSAVADRRARSATQFPLRRAALARAELVADGARPPPRLSFELRDESDRLLAGGGVERRRLGLARPRRRGRSALRRRRAAPRRRRFHFSLRPRRPENGTSTTVSSAAPFVVHPSAASVARLLEGAGRQGSRGAAELRGS